MRGVSTWLRLLLREERPTAARQAESNIALGNQIATAELVELARLEESYWLPLHFIIFSHLKYPLHYELSLVGSFP